MTRPRATGWRLPAAVLTLAFLVALAARLIAHDLVITADEDNWMRRAGGFTYGILNGQLGRTYQNGHPGVTTMWVAMLTLGPERMLQYADRVHNLRLVGRVPGFWDALVDARPGFALVTALLVTLIAGLAWRIFGGRVGALTGLLLALEPFYLAISQLVHMDAMLAGCMVASVLAALIRWTRDGGRGWLILSGVLAGLAILSKVPAIFLLPFVPMLGAGLLAPAWLRGEVDRRDALVRLTVDALIWTAATVLTFMAFWPAIWVLGPAEVLGRVADFTRETGGQAHEQGTFFWGQQTADPGPLFYPVAMAFRLPPVTVLGLALLAVVGVGARRLAPQNRWPALALLGYGLGFLLMMTLGAKKFDRYVLPIFPALCVLAALGLAAAYSWLHTKMAAVGAERGPWRGAAAALIVLLAVWPAASTYPYFLTYYNPLLGGGPAAQRVVMVGNGEGLDQVAAWLNAQPNAQDQWVISQSFDILQALIVGSGESLRDRVPSNADYVVLYRFQIQIGHSPRVLDEYLNRHTPEHVVWINGMEYARIYRGPKQLSAGEAALTPQPSQSSGPVRGRGGDVSPSPCARERGLGGEGPRASDLEAETSGDDGARDMNAGVAAPELPATGVRVGGLPTTAQLLILGVSIFVLALAPRMVALDLFPTSDEDSWMRRTGGFTFGLVNGQFGRTYQNGHPGVTTMWIGLLAQGTDGALRFADRVHGLRFVGQVSGYMDGLAQARVGFAVLGALGAAVSALLVWRLFGAGPAVLAGLALAAEPFLVANQQLVHVDGPLVTFTVLAALAALVRFTAGGSIGFLLLAGVSTGLALLSKTPALFLIGYVPLVAVGATLLNLPLSRARFRVATLRPVVRDLLLWGAVALVTFVALWPALWVLGPGEVLARIVDFTRETGGQPDEVGSFFLGQVGADPGPLYYPVSTLFRLSPFATVGLILAATLVWKSPARARAGWLLVFALGFGLMMTLGPKKFDRYLLPAIPALVILASLGWWQLAERVRRPAVRIGMAVALAVVLIFPLASVYPYALSYYNPLLGGGPVAQKSVMIGNGEGLDQAASWLNMQPEAAQLRVAAHSWDILAGLVVVDGEPLRDGVPDDADYIVTYGRRIQMHRWGPSLERYLAVNPPAYVVRINGIEYVHIHPGPKPGVQP